MATQTQRQLRPIVDFPLDVPVTLSLRYSEGKILSGPHGERVMYSLTDNRVMFVDPPVAQQITNLAINVRESFTITRKGSGHAGGPVSWEVARTPGQQPNGTFVVPALEAKPQAKAAGSATERDASRTLIEESRGLVDVFAAVWKYTRETYRDQIKPEEVRSFVTTAYIQRGRSAAL